LDTIVVTIVSENEIRLCIIVAMVPFAKCKCATTQTHAHHRPPNDHIYLFLVFFPNLQHLFVRKTDAVHSLQTVVVRVAQPVCGRVARRCKGFDFSSVRHVRSAAQINQVAAAVDRRAPPVRNLGRQNRNLEGIVGKQLQPFFFGNHHAFKLLLLFDDFIHLGFHQGI